MVFTLWSQVRISPYTHHVPWQLYPGNPYETTAYIFVKQFVYDCKLTFCEIKLFFDLVEDSVKSKEFLVIFNSYVM